MERLGHDYAARLIPNPRGYSDQEQNCVIVGCQKMQRNNVFELN
jgi:hypothetical protein